MPKQAEVTEIERLYREYGSALLLFASALAGERSRAQDAVHQVFLRLLDSGKLRTVQDRKAYLFASVRNALLNEGKLRGRNVAFEDDSVWFLPPERDFTAERNLRRAIGELPEDQRQVIVMHIWGELTFAQIAEVLEIGANTAASRYRYAISKLRDTMRAKDDSDASS